MRLRLISTRKLCLLILLLAGGVLVPAPEPTRSQDTKKGGKAAKKKAASNGNGLRRTADKLAVLEKIHKSFPARSIGDHVVFTSEDLDKNLKQRIGAEDSAYAPLVNDEGFLRRVSLDLTGQLPEPAEIKEFVADTDPKKRSKLIDRLLDSPEYAQHWAHYWRTVLTYNAPAKRNTVNYGALEDWLADEFEQNTGWDRIVCELIAATPRKPKKKDDNGPQEYGPNNFVLAYENKPGDIASHTARLFMGISIECAECHDHPFDRWKREQFHSMAAFFSPKKTYEMPDRDDPSKKTEIDPKFLLGEKPSPDLSPDALRVAIAAYLVYNPDNYWFSRSYVNRIWNELLGDGFYSVDSLGPDKEGLYLPVINRLGALFRYKDFNVKWVFRTIMNSQTYQRESRTLSHDEKLFTAVRPTRMRPDQVVAAVENVTGSIGKARRTVATTFAADLSIPQDSLEGSMQQALLLMNNEQLQKALSKSPLKRRLLEIRSDDELIDELYLSVLARKATAPELARGHSHLKRAASRSDAIDDLIWVLVNSTEFVTKK